MMDAAILRQSILDQAIKGRLVPQINTEESGSKLLDRVRDEKEKLIKENKLKQQKNKTVIIRENGSFYEKNVKGTSTCIDDEIPFDIPESWTWSRLGCIGFTQTGNTPRTSKLEYYSGDIPFIGPGNISSQNDVNYDTGRKLSIEGKDVARIAKKDSILQVCIGTLGKCCIVDREVAFNQQINSLQCILVYNKYIFFLMNSSYFQNTLRSKSTSTTISLVNRAGWESILIPIPPLEEQCRIVAKIETILPSLDEYDSVAELLAILDSEFPDKLKKSIYQYAIEGKLATQINDDEPASVLLENIRNEKENLISENKLKRNRNESVIIRKNGSYYEKIGKGDYVCIDDEIPYDIPDGWEWARLASITTKVIDGDHNPPRGTSNPTEYIMLSSRNINDNQLVDLYNVRYLTKEIFTKENERTQLGPGDVLFTSVGTLGRSCVFMESDYNICFQRSVTVITPLINSYYLKYFFDSPYYQSKVKSESTGTAQKGFYLRPMNKSLIAIPPLAEQQRIVDKIESCIKLLSL